MYARPIRASWLCVPDFLIPSQCIFPMFRDAAPGAAADSNAVDVHTAASAVKGRCMKTSEEKSVW